MIGWAMPGQSSQMRVLLNLRRKETTRRRVRIIHELLGDDSRSWIIDNRRVSLSVLHIVRLCNEEHRMMLLSWGLALTGSHEEEGLALHVIPPPFSAPQMS